MLKHVSKILKETTAAILTVAGKVHSEQKMLTLDGIR